MYTACYRQSESECAALAERTFYFDAAAVGLHHVTSDSQSQPAAPTFQASGHSEIGFRSRAIHFIEAFKDTRQVFG